MSKHTDTEPLRIRRRHLNGYQWYVFSTKWPPHATDYIWMGPPRFFNGKTPVEAVYLDRIEIIENK